jgi:hypothetical protein
MLRRAKKPQEPKQRKGFAFNPSLKLFRKRIYFGLSLEWEDTSQE